MLFLNLDGRTEIGAVNKYFGFEDGIKSEKSFVPCDLDIQGRTIRIIPEENSEWGANSVTQMVLGCSKEHAEKLNSKVRVAEEDTLVLTKAVRFIEGVRSYFRVIPFNGAMLFCLYAGAVELCVEGEWIPLSRMSGGFSSNAERVEYDWNRLSGVLSVLDKESDYDMKKDGSISVDAFYKRAKDGTKSMLWKVNKEEFVLLDETGTNKARAAKKVEIEEAKRKEEERIANRERNREIVEEYKRVQAQKAESKKKKPKMGKSVEKEKKESEAALDFASMLVEMGYKR
jgi:hypothetical protein